MVVIGRLTHLCGGGGCLILRQVPGLMRIGTLPLLQRRRYDELCYMWFTTLVLYSCRHACGGKEGFLENSRLVLSMSLAIRYIPAAEDDQ